jgi:hypothetical protein
MALMLAVSVAIDANNPANGSQAAPQDAGTDKPEEAPTGFNISTNRFEDQQAFDKDRETFEEVETISEGLGPVYNATSCVLQRFRSIL